MKTKMQMATFANGRDSGYPTEARWKTQKVVIAGGTRGSSQAEPWRERVEEDGESIGGLLVALVRLWWLQKYLLFLFFLG